MFDTNFRRGKNKKYCHQLEQMSQNIHWEIELLLTHNVTETPGKNLTYKFDNLRTSKVSEMEVQKKANDISSFTKVLKHTFFKAFMSYIKILQ